MNENSPVSDSQMLEIFKEQLRMFKEQLQVKDMEVMGKINERTGIALKVQVTERMIHDLENPLPAILTSNSEKPQFTREWVRVYMKYRKQWGYEPAQTKEIVDKFYRNETEEEKEKAIKILSVVFNNLIKSGEIEVEKKEGVKGNFYVWKGDI